MKLGSYTQSPAERKRYVVDYSDWLDTGETVDSASVSVTQVTPGTDLSPLSIDGQSIPSPSTSLVFFAALGTAGLTYSVDVLMTTSSGQIKEDTITFQIR